MAGRLRHLWLILSRPHVVLFRHGHCASNTRRSASYEFAREQNKDVITVDREIILMRHGQPDLVVVDKVSALDMKRWIERYDLSEIINQPAPKASVELAVTAKVIVSSSAPRALTSVRALGLQPTLIDEIFCEAQLPYGRWTLPRLSPFTWAFILRVGSSRMDSQKKQR